MPQVRVRDAQRTASISNRELIAANEARRTAGHALQTLTFPRIRQPRNVGCPPKEFRFGCSAGRLSGNNGGEFYVSSSLLLARAVGAEAALGDLNMVKIELRPCRG